MELDDLARILASADFFNICTDEQRKLLAFTCERRQHAEGTWLYREGEAPEGAHVLISGTVVSVGEGETGGRPYAINQAGAVIGELGLIVSRPRPVGVKALTRAETLLVPRQSFQKLMRQDSALARRAADYLAEGLAHYLGAIKRVHGRIADRS